MAYVNIVYITGPMTQCHTSFLKESRARTKALCLNVFMLFVYLVIHSTFLISIYVDLFNITNF